LRKKQHINEGINDPDEHPHDWIFIAMFNNDEERITETEDPDGDDNKPVGEPDPFALNESRASKKDEETCKPQKRFSFRLCHHYMGRYKASLIYV
jgi:hypothetical protein